MCEVATNVSVQQAQYLLKPLELVFLPSYVGYPFSKCMSGHHDEEANAKAFVRIQTHSNKCLIQNDNVLMNRVTLHPKLFYPILPPCCCGQGIQ